MISPYNVTADNYSTPWSLPVKWTPIKSKEVVEHMIGYRVSYRAVSRGDEKVQEEFLYFTARKENSEALIVNLESYTRYEIAVSWFSRKAIGSTIVTFGGELSVLNSYVALIREK